MPPLAKPAELPTWSQVWDSLPSMGIDEIRQHGLWFLQANRPDIALVLFKQGVARGDGWSALAIGAMYDPFESEAEGPGPGLKRITRPSADVAWCWYRLAQDRGEKRAGMRIARLEAHGIAGIQYIVSGPTPAPADCEQMMPDYGIP